MKSIITFGALFCAAVASSATAFPTPSEPLFVSRMVKRELLARDSTSSCGDYALDEPQKLQVGAYNDSATTYLTVTSDAATKTSILTALPSTSGDQGAHEFDFQTCNYQGFTQGYSRNSGYSMGAPLEFWGRVVTNITTSTADQSSQKKCLSAALNAAAENARVTSGTFGFEDCNETDSRQWFRLQEGLGGPIISYFPIKNQTGYKYEGQTPEYFKVDLHPKSADVNKVEFTSGNTDQYVVFV